MNFLGLEVGSWAEWFGALGSISAVILSLYLAFNKSKDHSVSSIYFDEDNGLVYFQYMNQANVIKIVEPIRLEVLEKRRFGKDYDLGQDPRYDEKSKLRLHCLYPKTVAAGSEKKTLLIDYNELTFYMAHSNEIKAVTYLYLKLTFTVNGKKQKIRTSIAAHAFEMARHKRNMWSEN